MSKQLEMPGPGERAEPAHLQPEATCGPIPDGELTWTAYRAIATPGASAGHAEDAPSSDRRAALQRTGTDCDAPPTFRGYDPMSEQRVDRSADDLQRESAFDPAQDDVSPQSE